MWCDVCVCVCVLGVLVVSMCLKIVFVFDELARGDLVELDQIAHR